MLRTFVLFISLLGLASCATPRTAEVVEPVPTETVALEVSTAVLDVSPERAAPLAPPTAALDRLATYGRVNPPTAAGQSITIVGPEGGILPATLIASVSELTGDTILYDTGNAVIRNRKINFVGSETITEGDAVAWLTEMLHTIGLAVVPAGPPGAHRYRVMDLAEHSLSQSPVFVMESDLPRWEGRKTYITSVLTFGADLEASRVRQALQQSSTKVANLGRINDVPGSRALVVSDFAHVVVTMRHLLDAIEAHTYRSSTLRVE